MKKKRMKEICRQAMNIRIIGAVVRTADSEGNPIEDTARECVFVYNREKISDDEVTRLLENGGYAYDPRILEMDRETADNLFPHRAILHIFP